jgi:hypothetical protein
LVSILISNLFQEQHMKQSFFKIVLPALLISAGMSGCKKGFLDREPLGRYISSDLATGSFESQILGVYTGMRAEGVSGVKFIAVTSIRSDDAEKGSSVSDAVDTENFFDNFNYTKDFWLLNDYWGDHYKLIGLANNVISDIDSARATDQPTLINKGEAKFIRAYAFFNLVRAFGEVPKLNFKVTSAAQANIPKSPVAEIYALIDADLAEAAAVLPGSWPSTYTGRLTAGAAMALQAKTFLYRQNWASALTAAKAVMNSGRYNLSTPYDRIFTEEGENSSESIFEIQALYTQTLNFGVQYATVQGIRGAGNFDLGWGWNTPTQSLADAFETGDPRKDATLLYSGRVNTPYGENIPPATAVVPRPYWNKKTYTNPAIRLSTNSRFGQWMNLRILRYADVVLMAAEAANEIGGAANTTEALNYLEMVRARARGTSTAVLPKIVLTDQAKIRDTIRHERRVELGMEHDRFFDLVRWGIARQTFVAQGKNYQERNRYLPIPQPEIDKSAGVLKQNPEY